MQRKSKWVAALIVLFAQQLCFAALSSEERRISQLALQQEMSAMSLLKTIVNINSGTDNIAGVRRVGKMIRAQLNALGFKTKWVSEPASMHKAATLIATHPGKSGQRILLIGHLDTVFSRHDKAMHFKRVDKQHAKGPGIIDDKGGVVVMLSALRALQQAHALKNTSITIVMTGDEEDSGKPTAISRKPLIDAAKNSDVALDVEPSITKDTATIARRGITMWTITSSGNQSHSATIFQSNVGAGAIFELARMLNTMRTDNQNEKYLSFNPGRILGGTTVTEDAKSARGNAFGKENVVAKTALARGDIRFIDTQQENTFKEKLLAIAKQHLPGTQSQVAFQQGIPAMPPTENNRRLLQQYSDVSTDLNMGAIKALDSGVRGAGDISFVASVVPASLSGLGPLGVGSHTTIEGMYVDSLSMQTQRLAILIYRLGNTDKQKN